MKRLFLLFAFMLLVVIGCGAPSDPVGNLKHNIPLAVEKYNALEPTVKQLTTDLLKDTPDFRKWKKLKLKIDESSLKYDVKETDSLVSPYEGVITFETEFILSSYYPTKQEAESVVLGQGTGGGVQRSYTATYLFQDGKWAHQKCVYQEELDFGRFGDSPTMDRRGT